MRCRKRRVYMSIKRIFFFAVISTSTLIGVMFLANWPPVFDYPQNGQGKPPTPGEFLQQKIPNNESYCQFKYGLPEELAYEENALEYGPELGSASPYRVLYNVIEARPNSTNSIASVTYATHITADFSNYVAEIARFWEGPISVAAFVPDADAEIIGKQLLHLCYCLEDMSRVSVHFVFPANETPYYLPISPSATEPTDCAITDISKLESYRALRGLVYPVNVCRNAAKKAARSEFVLVSDVQLVPSEKLAAKFLKMVAKYRKSGKYAPSNKVFVLPLFEVEAQADLPTTKNQLVALIRNERAAYFHRYTCSHCQKFPGLEKWLDIPNTQTVKPFVTVKREYPYHRWEPIYIGTKYEPYYSERLSWEGQQDKMTQMLEMCLMGYKFVILDGAFLVHWPGIKRNKNKNRSPYWEKNARQYNAIANRLKNRYSYKRNLKCTAQ